MTILARMSFAGGTLLIEGLPRTAVERLLPPGAAVWDGRVKAWRCDALRYRDFVNRSAAESIPVIDGVPGWRAVHWPAIKLPTLRIEQADAAAAWSATGRGLIVMPTGTGKTEVALAIVARAATSTLVVAPIRDLMHQWHRRILAALGYDAGIIGDSLFRVRPVSVTTYDSACIHMERLGNQFGLIVFDECHHLPGNIRRDAALMSAAPRRLGLTATPERSDGRHAEFDSLIGPLVYELPLAAAKGHSLADYDVIRIPVHLTPGEQSRYDRFSREVSRYLVDRRKTDPRYSWQDLCAESAATPEARRAMRAFYSKQSIENRADEKLRVLEDLFRLHAGEACLVFAGSNAMAHDVSRRFLIPCLLSHCKKHERREILTGLEEGHYPALVANQVLDEGVDLPAVKVAIVIGGMASTRQAKQRLGRVLRKSAAGRAVLYEVVCAGTKEEQKSRTRRASDAYQGTIHRRG